MKKRRSIFVFVLALALLGMILCMGSRGQWYHLKPLSVWLAEYGNGPADYKPSPKADKALRQIGPNAVPHLLHLLHSTNSYSFYAFVRKKNSAGFGFSFPLPTPATIRGRLTAWLEKFPFRFQRVTVPPSWDHWKAYLGFQALGSAGKSAIPDLVKLARDDPNGTSYFGNIQGMKDIDLVAKLADNSGTYVAPGDGSSFHGGSLIRNTEPFLVDGEIAAWSLAAIGADAVPSLMELLADHNPRLKQRAIEALGMVGAAAEPAVPALVKNLVDSDLEIRQHSADALGWIGSRPELAIPALTEALNDSDVGVQTYAARSLGSFGIRATNAIPALLANFAARDYRTRGSAATALSKISPETTAREVVPSLLHQLEATNSWHNGALIDLLQLNLDPDVMMPHLIKALDDSNGNDKSIQMNAIRGLGKYGSASKAAVPKLISLLADENPFVRQDATNALDKIEPAWRTGH